MATSKRLAGFLALLPVGLMGCDSGCPVVDAETATEPEEFCGDCAAQTGWEPDQERSCIDVDRPRVLVACIPRDRGGSPAVTCYQDEETGRIVFASSANAAIPEHSSLRECPQEVASMFDFCER